MRRGGGYNINKPCYGKALFDCYKREPGAYVLQAVIKWGIKTNGAYYLIRNEASKTQLKPVIIYSILLAARSKTYVGFTTPPPPPLDPGIPDAAPSLQNLTNLPSARLWLKLAPAAIASFASASASSPRVIICHEIKWQFEYSRL